MTAPVAGWYADPNGGSGLRYWDGAAWTDSAQAPPAPVPAAVSQYLNPGYAPGGYPDHTPQFPGQPYGAVPAQPTSPPRSGQPNAGAFLAANKFALITLAVCAIFALIATESHYVFFGVLPVFMTVRSFQAKEALKWLAVVAAAASVAYSLYRLNHG